MFEPFGYEERRNKQKDAVPSAVVAPQLTPSANVINNHEAVFPFIFAWTTSSAELNTVSAFVLHVLLFFHTVPLLVHC